MKLKDIDTVATVTLFRTKSGPDTACTLVTYKMFLLTYHS